MPDEEHGAWFPYGLLFNDGGTFSEVVSREGNGMDDTINLDAALNTPTLYGWTGVEFSMIDHESGTIDKEDWSHS
jgi:hypothetical protein